MKRSLCGAVGAAIPVFAVSLTASAGYIFDFEDSADLGYGDDSVLSRFAMYEAGGCTFRLGWDTNHDFTSDQDLRIEDYNDGASETAGVGGYSLASYSTQFQDGASSWDNDYNHDGGNWFVRANKENGYNRTTGRLLVAMEGNIWQVGGRLNDLDHGERYTITAYSSDGSIVDSISSPSYAGVGGETLNGRSWTFTLGGGDEHYNIAFMAIEMVDDGTGGGFGFDNLTFIPAPGAIALVCLAGLVKTNGRRRR